MPRGGARPGAGRPRKNPPAAKAVAHAPTGVKDPETPPGWPFGTAQAPAEPEPPAAPEQPRPDLSALTPLDYLLSVIRDHDADKRDRMQAASLAAPYIHAKPAAVGKKEGQREAAAKTAASGKFAPSAPPKLVHSR